MRGVLLSLLLCLTSCGYHFGRGDLIERYRTVCIPYVEGDDQGYLTTALIRAMTTNGALGYRSCNSDLVLRVCLLKPVDTNIGFAYAPPKDKEKKNKKKNKIIVSNEARLTTTATVRLVDRSTGNCILGPCEITSFITYDFEPDLSNIDFHAFSLGQLERHNLAQDAATPALYTILAEKIVDYVNHSW